MHGGASPQARAAAQRRKVAAEATALLEVIWDPDAAPVTDPVSALQSMAGKLQHLVDVLGARVSSGGLVDEATAAAWARGQRELRLSLDSMARLGIAERHVELEQERAQLVTAALLAVLGELRLLPADRDFAIRLFLAHLKGEPPPSRDGLTVVQGELK